VIGYALKFSNYYHVIQCVCEENKKDQKRLKDTISIITDLH